MIESLDIIDYLFVRSAYRDIPEAGEAREAIRYFTNIAKEQWKKQPLYYKGAIAWVMWRNGEKEVAHQILAWLRKTATVSTEKGMYWANNREGIHYFFTPIDTHCLLMNLLHEVDPNQQELEQMALWLFNQKRTQIWETIPATCQAIHALLTTGNNGLTTPNSCTIQWDNQSYSTDQGEAATGYLKIVHKEKEEQIVTNSQLTITKEGEGPVWGAVYRQYFQPVNQVQKQKGALHIEKQLFVEKNSGSKTQLELITSKDSLQVGDKVIIRLTIRSDRTMDFVALKDMRAGCFEPTNPRSGIVYRNSICYYQSSTDLSEHFFFERLPQGTYVLEYPVYVSRKGVYADGISTLQCLYAPEFISHTKGETIRVN
ncbi:MAG: hypothetical protein Q4A54_06515 [Parabacteroides sp.]|nr:hypothetical protein [Parabacteroides sp.]